MSTYSYETILCNGRTVLIDDIIGNKAVPDSKFEEALFTFMREWIGGAVSFALHTSGSTGAPKRISAKREQMITSASLTAQALQLRNGQTALICLSPEFIAGKMMIVRSLVSGLRIVAVEPSASPLQHIDQRIDFAAMVPLQVHDLLHVHQHTFADIGTVIIGGGTISDEDVELLQPLPCRFYATYGMTETVSHVALRRLNGENSARHFTALPGITFHLDDRGCLVIHWPVFGHDVVTNDLVELLDIENFIWLGRWDNVINSGGRKILPEILEARIAKILKDTEHEARIIVAGIPDVRLGTKLVLVIERLHSEQNNRMLLDTLKSSLQSFEVPKVVLSYFPFVETHSGKINRSATLELAISDARSTD